MTGRLETGPALIGRRERPAGPPSSSLLSSLEPCLVRHPARGFFPPSQLESRPSRKVKEESDSVNVPSTEQEISMGERGSEEPGPVALSSHTPTPACHKPTHTFAPDLLPLPSRQIRRCSNLLSPSPVALSTTNPSRSKHWSRNTWPQPLRRPPCHQAPGRDRRAHRKLCRGEPRLPGGRLERDNEECASPSEQQGRPPAFSPSHMCCLDSTTRASTRRNPRSALVVVVSISNPHPLNVRIFSTHHACSFVVAPSLRPFFRHHLLVSVSALSSCQSIPCSLALPSQSISSPPPSNSSD